jgi:hypothetical protein
MKPTAVLSTLINGIRLQDGEQLCWCAAANTKMVLLLSIAKISWQISMKSDFGKSTLNYREFRSISGSLQ